MQSISGRNITITRGDTLVCSIALEKDGDPYVPEESDVIRFAVSQGYVGNIGYRLLYEKEIDHETMTLKLSSEETKWMPDMTYNYDVQITHSDGSVDTVISGHIIIVGEVE